MAIPVLAAAWRLSLAGLVVVVATAATLTWLQVWVPDGSPAWSTRIEQVHDPRRASSRPRRSCPARGAGLVAVGGERSRTWSPRAAVEEEKLSAVGRGAIAHEVRNPVTIHGQCDRRGALARGRRVAARRARGASSRRRRGACSDSRRTC